MKAREGMDTLISMTYLLPLIILIEGFASIAVEILAIRQLLPVAGGNVVVTSLIIGIFLLFLALGYEKGGRVIDSLHQRLRINFFVAGLWVGIGLSYLFIMYFFNLLQTIIGHNIVYPLIIYLLLIIAPAIFLLGQTLPITMNIVRQNRTAGAIAGKALGLSTVGSFLGAVGTTIVLMHYFGVALTVFIIFASLILLSLLLSQTLYELLTMSVLSLAASIFVYALNIGFENQYFTRTTNYADYRVLTHQNSKLREDEKLLIINEVYSAYTNENKNGFPYIEIIRKILFDDLMMREADILVLGAGGFSLSETDLGLNHFTYVDIDDQITKIIVPAYRDQIKETLVIDDARHFVHATQKKYDAIVTDVYSDTKTIPAHLLTREFMLDIKKALQPNGYAIFNVIGHPTFSDRYTIRIDNTIRSVFGSCVIIPTNYNKELANLIYACSNQTDTRDHVIYTDNLNNSATDSFRW